MINNHSYTRIYLVSAFFILALFQSGFSSPASHGPRIGFGYSTGRQQMFPFNSRDYKYDPKGYKVMLNFPIGGTRLDYELQLEPSYYIAKHQLLEELFVQPKDYSDYLLKREVFSKLKTIREYAFNIGIIIRYNFSDLLSLYFLGSTGPMISDTETERLAKGLAFSDIVGIGASVRIQRISIDLRPGLRHVSNANLQLPNCGHNSTTLDISLSYDLKKEDRKDK